MRECVDEGIDDPVCAESVERWRGGGDAGGVGEVDGVGVGVDGSGGGVVGRRRRGMGGDKKSVEKEEGFSTDGDIWI